MTEPAQRKQSVVSVSSNRRGSGSIAGRKGSKDLANRRQSLNSGAEHEGKNLGSKRTSTQSRQSTLLEYPIPSALRRNSRLSVIVAKPDEGKVDLNSTQSLVASLTTKLFGDTGIAPSPPKRKPARKKKDQQPDDIFTTFGEENGPTDGKNNKVTGGVQKAINIRKHWNSDGDIRRWQQALTDSSRFDKLLTDVRYRWHPDFGMDRAHLVQSHNALFRQRDDQDSERKDEKKTAVTQLRDLQTKISPPKKEKSHKKVHITFEGLSLFGSRTLASNGSESSFPSPYPSPVAAAKEERQMLKRTHSSESIGSINSPKQESLPLRQDDCTRSSSLDSTVPSVDMTGRTATSVGFFPSSPSSGEMQRIRPVAEGKVQLLKGGLPRTFTLLLYRNGERTQKCGEAVFFQRVPKDIAELLRICGQGCKPLIAPVEALLDSSLRPVRDVQDVRSGGIFLLKGKEKLDPPLSFFHRGVPHSGSMRHLTEFQRHNNSAPSLLLPRGMCKLDVPQESMDVLRSHYAKNPSAVHLPFVGGPPVSGGRSGVQSGERSDSSSARRDDQMRNTWTVDDKISWRLSYGGLVNNLKHHDYSCWPSPLPVSSRSDVMRSTR